MVLMPRLDSGQIREALDAPTAQVPSDVVASPSAPYLVRVADVHRLSPRFTRLTFDGPGLSNFAYDGADQRLKLVLPNPESGELVLPDSPHWAKSWLDMPQQMRPIVRTYSIRAYRSKSREVDVDFVLHDNGGPASEFARKARIGDEVGLIGPNAQFDGKRGCYEFLPPSKSCKLLIVADETAVPAVAAIIERLPWDARGVVLLEVPAQADQLDFRAPAGVDVRWLPRELGNKTAPRGARLLQALREAAREMMPNSAKLRQPAKAFDVDEDVLWDVPSNVQRPRRAAVYTWVAAEAGALRVLRHFLVSEHGVDRRTAAFMGYWREGIASHDVSIQIKQVVSV